MLSFSQPPERLRDLKVIKLSNQATLYEAGSIKTFSTVHRVITETVYVARLERSDGKQKYLNEH